MARWTAALIAIAALAGAAGVIEAAAAAHGVSDPRLATAAHFLLLNAAATIALTGAAQTTRCKRVFLIGASVLLGGGLLFCGDLSLRAGSGQKLFPFAAPIGGSLMILGWLLAAGAAMGCVLAGSRNEPG